MAATPRPGTDGDLRSRSGRPIRPYLEQVYRLLGLVVKFPSNKTGPADDAGFSKIQQFSGPNGPMEQGLQIAMSSCCPVAS